MSRHPGRGRSFRVEHATVGVAAATEGGDGGDGKNSDSEVGSAQA